MIHGKMTAMMYTFLFCTVVSITFARFVFICVCIRCDAKEEFKGITNFSEHMLTFHLDVGIVCPVCDKQPFNSKKLLKLLT